MRLSTGLPSRMSRPCSTAIRVWSDAISRKDSVPAATPDDEDEDEDEAV